jgi:replicative DNA helicase
VAANLALDSAVRDKRVSLIHAMEMSRRELGQRFAAKTGSLQLEDILAGRLTPTQEDHLDWCVSQVEGSPLVIDDVEEVSLSRLRASIRKHKAEVVIVDQIPIMTVDDPKAPRERQISDLACGLRRLAKAENVLIVACAQLNSESAKRANKRPTLQDIRESRAIGHYATRVIMLHDPTEGEGQTPQAGEIEWIIRKNRQGRRDITISLAQQFHYSRLADLYQERS